MILLIIATWQLCNGYGSGMILQMFEVHSQIGMTYELENN